VFATVIATIAIRHQNLEPYRIEKKLEVQEPSAGKRALTRCKADHSSLLFTP